MTTSSACRCDIDHPITDLDAPPFEADLYGEIEELRQTAFVAKTPKGHVLFNQEDASYVMRCEDFRFAFHQIDRESSPYLADAIEHELLNMHGAEHTRVKKLVSAALRERVVESLREQIRQVSDDLIDAMPDDGIIDFNIAFADPLPGRILGPMYGIPYEAADDLNEAIKIGGRKVSALQSGDDITAVENANRYVHDYLRSILDDRKSNLGTDIFSELIITEVDGDTLTDDELVYLTSELASAGVDTTRAQLPSIILALLEHPTQLQLLREQPELALRAVDEGMRFAPLPWALPHTATRDLTYKGLVLDEGDLVHVLVPALNRDPAVIERPNDFDISRPRTRNFSFGYGAHVCPAAHLARIEMAEALGRLIKRLDSIELVDASERDPLQKGGTPTALRIHIRKRT